MPGGAIRLACAALALCLIGSGCINVGAMTAKVLMGNPKATSAFEQRTGISLKKEQLKVAVVCTAPSSVVAEFDGLEYDVQEEVTRRMRFRELNVASDDEVTDALNRTNGRFDKDTLATALADVNYILHVDVERFTHTEDGNPELYRSHTAGVVYAYEVLADQETAGRPRAIKVFFKEFDTRYPATQPILADNMSARVFQQKCVDDLAELVGRMFYDVETAELFN
jgi:hypothetical protein